MRLPPLISSIVVLIALSMLLLEGCASQGLQSIPGSAMLVQESGSAFTFTATERGTVYLRDRQADKVVYHGPMSPGDQLQVDTRAQRLTVAGKTVKTPPLRADATYQVFFLAGERHEYHPMMNP